ncbi:MAG: hypothetical protein QM790_17800 [Nibricoccus sp.]
MKTPKRFFLGCTTLLALIFACSAHAATSGASQIGFSYKPTVIKDSVAANQAMHPDGYAISISVAAQLKHNILFELGWDIFTFKSISSLTGGTIWHETKRVNDVSYGYALPAYKTTIQSHGLHTQFGYRFEFVTPERYGWGVWADASAGYLTILTTRRKSGEIGDFTNQVRERMSLKNGWYVQPRLVAMYGTGKSTGGLQVSYEDYADSDFRYSWTIGAVFSTKF